MDNIFRVFMYVLPYGFSIAAYIWVGSKALKVKHKILRAIALVMLAGGLGYTLYKLVRSVGSLFTNDNFEFAIIIANVFVLFFASIAMAFGEPEEEQPTRKQGTENPVPPGGGT